MKKLLRCGWVSDDPLYISYHDQEWGKPCRDNRHLFEMICLEGQQTGLSWITILKKRQNYRDAFFQFNPEKIGNMTDEDIQQQLNNSGIIRNKSKIQAIVKNAKAYLAMQENGENFADFIWSFAPENPVLVRHEDYRNYPAQTQESEQMSKALKKKGFVYVGPVVCYAFMQAVGLVDDHSKSCFCAK